MKSVVRDTSSAWGLKTRRPPATILIPGSRGVARSRRRGKSRTICEFRSSSFGQVSLTNRWSSASHSILHDDYLLLARAVIPTSGHSAKAEDAKAKVKPRRKTNIVFLPLMIHLADPVITNTSSCFSNILQEEFESLHKVIYKRQIKQREWIFLQTNWSLSVTQLLIISWAQPDHIFPKPSGFQKPFRCDKKTSRALDVIFSCVIITISQCAWSMYSVDFYQAFMPIANWHEMRSVTSDFCLSWGTHLPPHWSCCSKPGLDSGNWTLLVERAGKYITAS